MLGQRQFHSTVTIPGIVNSVFSYFNYLISACYMIPDFSLGPACSTLTARCVLQIGIVCVAGTSGHCGYGFQVELLERVELPDESKWLVYGVLFSQFLRITEVSLRDECGNWFSEAVTELYIDRSFDRCSFGVSMGKF